MPWSEDAGTDCLAEVLAEWGWAGRGPVATPNDGVLGLKLSSEFDHELPRYHLVELFGSGRPMWICYDPSQGDRSSLALRPHVRLASGHAQASFPPQTPATYLEHPPPT